MKVWKLVSGILSIILFVLVTFQSCAAGVANTLENNGEMSGSAGVIVAIFMLAGGIVSIATRKSTGKGGNIALVAVEIQKVGVKMAYVDFHFVTSLSESSARILWVEKSAV